TILISLLEELDLLKRAPEIKFLASDIDRAILEQASKGVYSASEIRTLPEKHARWFKPIRTSGSDDVRYIADKKLRDSITFAPLNLMDAPYPFKNQFDLIFCRNVLIYFDRDTSQRVVGEMARHLRPGGFLFLGHSEAGVLRPDSLKVTANAVYQKTGKIN
ncbi:MAG: methyltransferase domain-containing protein, partial [Proteobacteria bacterium]|nr:methyltransferase domain-containing protein [Pseudomonadota bacterium]